MIETSYKGGGKTWWLSFICTDYLKPWNTENTLLRNHESLLLTSPCKGCQHDLAVCSLIEEKNLDGHQLEPIDLIPITRQFLCSSLVAVDCSLLKTVIWFVGRLKNNKRNPFFTTFFLSSLEPTSSTSTETREAPNREEGEQAEREVPCGSEEEGSDMDQTDQQAPSSIQESPESSRDGEESSSSDPVSSSSSSIGSSCSTEEGAEAARGDAAVAPSSSTTEPPTDGATSNTDTTEEPMEQD